MEYTFLTDKFYSDYPHDQCPQMEINGGMKCGVDYSKAVVINSEDYIDRTRKTFIRPDEYKKLVGKDFRIREQFESYIKLILCESKIFIKALKNSIQTLGGRDAIFCCVYYLCMTMPPLTT